MKNQIFFLKKSFRDITNSFVLSYFRVQRFHYLFYFLLLPAFCLASEAAPPQKAAVAQVPLKQTLLDEPLNQEADADVESEADMESESEVDSASSSESSELKS